VWTNSEGKTLQSMGRSQVWSSARPVPLQLRSSQRPGVLMLGFPLLLWDFCICSAFKRSVRLLKGQTQAVKEVADLFESRADLFKRLAEENQTLTDVQGLWHIFGEFCRKTWRLCQKT